ncbi:hypothetical protein [Steroidobacter cummioxidans]|uniref:hypothetical protein n=1 Tax=Steroidobacter cummioxidans TaxID=1803913 RepID=UPI001379CBA4|nr:hypothetical protein [Steroidobacter cummioxidans]
MSPFKRICAAMLAIAAIVVSTGTAAAQDRERQLSKEQRAQIEQHLAEVRARLRLTPEQESQLQPILRSSFEKRIAALEANGFSRGGQRPSLQQMRSLRTELARLREATEGQVAAVLDERQMAEFRKIQDEMREQMRTRAKERRR